MGWGKIRRITGLTWSSGDLNAAASLCAAQLPAVGLLAWIASFGGDDYGVGYGGAPAALGVLCLLVFAPLLLPFLGVVQALTLTLPSAVLARLAARRFGGPGWAWNLAAPVVPAAAWGGLTALLWDWPPVTTVVSLTALGALPALGVGYVRTRAWRPWGVWWRSALASVPLFVLALGGGIAATAAGLVPEYEPPKLTAAQLAGVWRGPSGAELRLRPGGRAEATRLATEPTFEEFRTKDFVMCGGSGTWEPDSDPDNTGRDGVLLRLDGDCGEDTHWSIGGTEDAPELFVLFGDPDAGELWILKPAAAG
ncbi:hypothetical protein ACIPSA_16125 [Streptomyces sp. NPDC086549]|uniref:hypothetical protein n=1 Tax=Streptomyces sp. NPDC086549 TaxID=3365752 RepID=UPI003810C384